MFSLPHELFNARYDWELVTETDEITLYEECADRSAGVWKETFQKPHGFGCEGFGLSFLLMPHVFTNQTTLSEMWGKAMSGAQCSPAEHGAARSLASFGTWLRSQPDYPKKFLIVVAGRKSLEWCYPGEGFEFLGVKDYKCSPFSLAELGAQPSDMCVCACACVCSVWLSWVSNRQVCVRVCNVCMHRLSWQRFRVFAQIQGIAEPT